MSEVAIVIDVNKHDTVDLLRFSKSMMIYYYN